MPILYVFKSKKMVSRVQIDEYVNSFTYQDKRKELHTLPVHIIFSTTSNSCVRAVLVASSDIPDFSMIIDVMNHGIRKK